MVVSSWLLYAIATGIWFGLQTIAIKHTSGGWDRFNVLSVMFLTASLAFIPFISLFNIVSMSSFIIWTALSALLNYIAFSLLYLALKNGPVSLISPFLNLTPLFIIITGRIVVGEILNSQQQSGIVLIVCGALLLQAPEIRKGIKNTNPMILAQNRWENSQK